MLSGNVGLLFTNEDKEVVLKTLNNFTEIDYPKVGFVPNETIVVKKGKLTQFPHSMEVLLRNLGKKIIKKLKNKKIKKIKK